MFLARDRFAIREHYIRSYLQSEPSIALVLAKDPDTKYPPIRELRPPAGAPNVLIVLIDDVGFGRDQRVRRTVPDAELREARRERPEIQSLPHDCALLAA